MGSADKLRAILNVDAGLQRRRARSSPWDHTLDESARSSATRIECWAFVSLAGQGHVSARGNNKESAATCQRLRCHAAFVYVTAFTSNSVQRAANAHRSAVSAIALSVGLPAPWPARVSMRARCGLGPMGADGGRLKRSDVFEGVAGHHAVVRVGGGGEDGGVRLAALDVVMRRMRDEVAEVRFLRRIAMLIGPKRTGRELVESHRGPAR